MASNHQNGDRRHNTAANLPRRSRKQILVRTVKEFQDDNLTDWAAALTYYGVMSLFPMLIALVAVLGVFGQEHSVVTLIGSFREAGVSDGARKIEEALPGGVDSEGGGGAAGPPRPPGLPGGGG